VSQETEEVAPRDLRIEIFPHQRDYPIRWADIDRYGHLNNAVQYLMMDTLINDFVADAAGMPPHHLPAVGLVVETGCLYLQEILPTHQLRLGLRCLHTGSSSIRYQVGFFVSGSVEPAAVSRFSVVYADPQTRRPTAIPPVIKAAAEAIRS
jgi:acyl-CoA thioester hydrolase